MRSSSFVGKFQVLAIKRLRNSFYGNPKWEIVIEAIHPEHNTMYIAKTATNASCGYLLDYHSFGHVYEMSGHFTKDGNVIIETAEEV